MPGVLTRLFILRIVAQGFLIPIAFVAVGRWFDADRGIAPAITSVGRNVGQMLLPLVFVTISATLGWRGAWLVLAAALVLATPFLASLSRVERRPGTTADPGARADPADRAPSRTLSQALKRPEFYAYVFAILPMAFVASTIFFYQVHLVESRFWSLDVFTASYSVMAISTVGSGFAAGGWSTGVPLFRCCPIVWRRSPWDVWSWLWLWLWLWLWPWPWSAPKGS